ncbi:hypothetical protein NDU88_003793 [Pleurodeles waltl]|uniref:Uncharacterized protein n=1 Tax=Pleurodeles waltl TaxID=8319 RepID=A0AAV7LJL1_PLEWA|nr:hypothetical protein NDU88_003793 [Pleurodeles waltl]
MCNGYYGPLHPSFPILLVALTFMGAPGAFPWRISVALRCQRAARWRPCRGRLGQSQHKSLAEFGACNEGSRCLKLLRVAGEGKKVLPQLLEMPAQSLDGELSKGADNKAQPVKRMKKGGSERQLLRPGVLAACRRGKEA